MNFNDLFKNWRSPVITRKQLYTVISKVRIMLGKISMVKGLIRLIWTGNGRFINYKTKAKGGSIIDLAMNIYSCDARSAVARLEEMHGHRTPFSFSASDLYARTKLAEKKRVDPLYIWNKSIKADHEYLKQKKISIGNARVNDYKGELSLVVPLTYTIPTKEDDLQELLKALQYISENGGKRFSGLMKGLFHVASAYNCNKDTIVFSEGLATARSIAEATGLCTIAVMSCWNFKPVVLKIHEQFPDSKKVLAADNDEAGLKAVNETLIALEGNGEIFTPQTLGLDFNDVYCLEQGSDKVLSYFSHLIKESEHDE